MEFLIQLEDKINIQVFCFNPIHKDNYMSRVIFHDDTFNAACPECKSSKYLYRKNDKIIKKGHFITFKPDGWAWGTNEFKHYGIIRINCTYEEAQELCSDNGYEINNVNYRPRKNILEFEKFLLKTDLDKWKNENEESKIVSMSTANMVNVKGI